MSRESHTLIAPEELCKDTRYAFTISPDDSFQQFSQPNTMLRFEAFKKVYSKYLFEVLAPFSYYKFWIEISQKGRLHLHGTIEVSDILGFYMSIHKLIANNTCFMSTITAVEKPLSKYKSWEDYCTKQNSIWGDTVRIISTTRKLPTLPGQFFSVEILEKPSNKNKVKAISFIE